MPITFAAPSLPEAEAFAALHVACWQEAYRGVVPDEILDRVTAADRLSLWNAVLADESRVVIGAYEGGAPVGFVMAGPPLEPLFEGMDGHVPAFYIRASHHRRGIGRRLLGRAAAGWLSRGGRSLALGCWRRTPPRLPSTRRWARGG